MSGRRRQAVSPSLFPFLAVLVCTLGTLILFLALVAQKATKTAEQQVAEAEQQARQELSTADSSGTTTLTVNSVASMIAEEEFRLTQVVAFRDEQAADLGAKRDHLTHIEDHLQRVRDELMRLSEEVKRATGEEEAEAIDEATVAFLNEKLKEEEKMVSKLKENSENQTPRVVIVPHKGPNGTDRRPVYLECTKDGVMLWPEGVRITPEQIENTSRGANPIDAALRIVRHHCLQNYGDPIAPYPLLVVRPNGIETYAAARAAMEDWDDQFGYELVPAEVELAFNPPDPQLKKRIDLAVRDAIVGQQARAEISQLVLGGRSRTGRGSDAGKPLPTLSAKQLDRQGRTNGFHKSSDNVIGSPDYYASSNPYATADTAANHSKWSANDRGTQHTNSSLQNGPGQTGGEIDAAISAQQMQRIENEMEVAAAEMRTQSAAMGKMANAKSDEELILGSGLGDSFANNSARSAPSTEFGLSLNEPDTSSSGTISEVGQYGLAERSAPGDAVSSTSAAREFSMPETRSPFDSSTRSGGAYSDSDSTSAGQAIQGSAASGSPGSTQQGASGMAGASGSSGSSGSPPPESETAASENQPGGSTSIRNRPASLSASRSAARQQNWAVPEHVANAKGNLIVRTIRVVCYEDQFVLLAPSTGGATEIFGFSDGNLSQATLDLGTAVKKRVSGWGPSFPGGRWQPVLNVEVMQGGEERFRQLQQLMQSSGVDVQSSGDRASDTINNPMERRSTR